MKSRVTESFVDLYRKLPKEIRELAKKNYLIWQSNPHHPSLQLKKSRFRKIYIPFESEKDGGLWDMPMANA